MVLLHQLYKYDFYEDLWYLLRKLPLIWCIKLWWMTYISNFRGGRSILPHMTNDHLPYTFLFYKFQTEHYDQKVEIAV